MQPSSFMYSSRSMATTQELQVLLDPQDRQQPSRPCATTRQAVKVRSTYIVSLSGFILKAGIPKADRYPYGCRIPGTSRSRLPPVCVEVLLKHCRPHRISPSLPCSSASSLQAAGLLCSSASTQFSPTYGYAIHHLSPAPSFFVLSNS